MSETSAAVFAFLDGLGIRYRVAEHPPAFTMEDCAGVDKALGSLTVKNIFLTTRSRRRYYLCLAMPSARFRTAQVSRQVGSPRLSFAPEEELFARLRCHGGSASPLGLIFPEAGGVGLLVDAALPREGTLSFHPCDNTRTVAMAAEDFFGRFLPAAGVTPVTVTL